MTVIHLHWRWSKWVNNSRDKNWFPRFFEDENIKEFWRSCNSLEVEVFESEVSFHDTGGLDSRSQYVLLCGDVTGGSKSVQCIQITGKDRQKPLWMYMYQGQVYICSGCVSAAQAFNQHQLKSSLGQITEYSNAYFANFDLLKRSVSLRQTSVV